LAAHRPPRFDPRAARRRLYSALRRRRGRNGGVAPAGQADRRRAYRREDRKQLRRLHAALRGQQPGQDDPEDRMTMSRNLLVLSGGHPYEPEPFAELLASFTGWTVTHLVHPEAEAAVAAGAATDVDAILFYDMPGYSFEGGKATTRPPSFTYRRAIIDHFAGGGGAVAMHHA